MKLVRDENFLGNANSLAAVNVGFYQLVDLLKLAWSRHSFVSRADSITKIKCLSIQILSKAGIKCDDEFAFELFDMAFKDEDDQVQMEAVSSMPVIALCSGYSLLGDMFVRLE